MYLMRIGAPGAEKRAGCPASRGNVSAPPSTHRTRERHARPDEPILFTTSPNTLIGPHDDVRIPRGSTKTDWEAELGIVIGRRTSCPDSVT